LSLAPFHWCTISQLVIPTAARLRFVEIAIQKSGFATLNLWIFLFNNNHTPNRNTVYADLTYATTTPVDVNLTPAGWSAGALVGVNGGTTWGAVPIEFVGAAAPQTIYGYGVVDVTDDTLMWAERVDTPFALAVGQKVEVIPKFQFGSIYDPAP